MNQNIKKYGIALLLVALCVALFALPASTYQMCSYTPTFGGIDAYTKLMLHGNGTDGSTTITDSELAPTKTVTAYGNAQIDTADYVFGGASILFDGTGDFLQAADHDDFWFAANPFTIDLRVQFINFTGGDIPGAYVLVGQRFDGNNQWQIIRQAAGTVRFYFYSSGVFAGDYTTTSTVNFVAGTKHHLELVRNGTSAYLFLDGFSQALTASTSFSTNSIGNVAAPLTIGGFNHSAIQNCVYGRIDEVRISKGIARHTANFTPPAQEYTE